MRIIAFGAVMALFFGFLAKSNPAPQTYVVEAMEIDECSGMVLGRTNPGLLYVHNDSGGEATVFALDTQGRLKHRLELQGTRNRDWEDIAISSSREGSYIYVGEIGDNSARYPEIYVYRFREPDLSSATQTLSITEIDTIRIVYEDGARDAEALIVDPENLDIYIISKREPQVGVYRIAYPQSTTELNTAEKVATLPLSWVTAADISDSGRKVLIKTYTSVYRLDRGKRQSLTQAFGNRLKSLPYIIEPQGEAICFGARGKGRYTLSERAPEQELLLYHYRK